MVIRGQASTGGGAGSVALGLAWAPLRSVRPCVDPEPQEPEPSEPEPELDAARPQGKRAAKLVALRAAFDAGESSRQASRTAGVSINTAIKWRRTWGLEVDCKCGKPSGHKGRCLGCFKRSPRRQAFVRDWAKPTISVDAVRTSCKHWTELSGMLNAIERLFEAYSRLDAHRRPLGDSTAEVFEMRLAALVARLDRELDRTTVELLTAQHIVRVAAETEGVA